VERSSGVPGKIGAPLEQGEPTDTGHSFSKAEIGKNPCLWRRGQTPCRGGPPKASGNRGKHGAFYGEHLEQTSKKTPEEESAVTTVQIGKKVEKSAA